MGAGTGRTDLEEYDLTLGVEGRFGDGLDYDVHARYYRHDAVVKGDTFVSESLARAAIESGAYDVANPLSPDNREAVRETALRLTHNTVVEHTTASATLEGTALTMPGGDVRWTAGLAVDDEDWRDIYDYRDHENRFYDVTDVLGTADNSSAGERLRLSVLAEATAPVLTGWDLTLGARRDNYDDVGETHSWRVANRYRLNDAIALRASWDRSARPPHLADMYRREAPYHPYVCDPLSDGLCSQPKSVISGDPNLKPDEAERISAGATANLGGFLLAADWFAVEISDSPAIMSSQVIVDLDAEGNTPPGTRVVREGGLIKRIENSMMQAGEIEAQGIGPAGRRRLGDRVGGPGSRCPRLSDDPLRIPGGRSRATDIPSARSSPRIVARELG